MRGIEGEQVLLRLILGESRHHQHKPLFRVSLELLRKEGLVIEVVDSQEQIDRVLPQLGPLMEGGVIMLERAHVIRYTRSEPPPA